MERAVPGRIRALLAFAGFGGFWGAWGAELPAIQSHAGVGDGALGLALLCIGAGALASMRPAGVLVDRFGARVMPLALLAFAASAVGPALALSATGLAFALLLLGATSGAVDVCANSEATRAERPDRPLLSLAHATFSAAVVAASLLVGVLRSAGSGPITVLGIIAAALALLALVVARSRPAQAEPAERSTASEAARSPADQVERSSSPAARSRPTQIAPAERSTAYDTARSRPAEAAPAEGSASGGARLRPAIASPTERSASGVARLRTAQAEPAGGSGHGAAGLPTVRPNSGSRSSALGSLLRVPRPLAILGGLIALAFFVENAWQSWSAVQLEVTLDASPGVASLGPAVFAAAAVAGRLGGHGLATRVADRIVIGAGAAVATAGTLLGALAPDPGPALVGIALAGLGTSVCAPTLFSLAGRIVPAAEHGSAVSAVTTLGYLGFLVGPAAVGLAAGAADLPTALALVAGLAALLAATARFAPLPAGHTAR